MKWCFYMLLLAVPYVARSQHQPGLFDAIPHWHPDSALLRQVPVPLLDADRGDWQEKLLSVQQPSVRSLAPDRMPCLFPSLTGIEWMPVNRGHNTDKMPNPLKGRGSEHPLYHWRTG